LHTLVSLCRWFRLIKSILIKCPKVVRREKGLKTVESVVSGMTMFALAKNQKFNNFTTGREGGSIDDWITQMHNPANEG
jgi:hypothetical protein